MRFIEKFMTEDTFEGFLEAYIDYWKLKQIIVLEEELSEGDILALKWDFANTMAVREGRQPLPFIIRKKKAPSPVEVKNEPTSSSDSDQEQEIEKDDEKDNLSTHAQETFSEDEGKGESSVSSKTTTQEMQISCKNEVITKREIKLPKTSDNREVRKTYSDKSGSSISIEEDVNRINESMKRVKLSVSEWKHFEIRRYMNYPDLNAGQAQNKAYRDHLLSKIIRSYTIINCKNDPLNLMQRFPITRSHVINCTNLRFGFIRNVLRGTPSEPEISFSNIKELAPSELVNNDNILWMTANLGYAVNRTQIIRHMIQACIENLGIEKRQWEENTQGWVYKKHGDKIRLEVGPVYDKAFHYGLAFLSEVEQLQNVKLNHCDILYDIARGYISPTNENPQVEITPTIRTMVKMV